MPPKGKCNRCGAGFIGWALLQEKYRTCKCGGQIEDEEVSDAQLPQVLQGD